MDVNKTSRQWIITSDGVVYERNYAYGYGLTTTDFVQFTGSYKDALKLGLDYNNKILEKIQRINQQLVMAVASLEDTGNGS